MGFRTSDLRGDADNTGDVSEQEAKLAAGLAALPPGLRLSVALARLVVRCIQRYYAHQVLEPSVRGFLGILEKQFPRNDLYLFELLQNAVDDGASHVVFEHPKSFYDVCSAILNERCGLSILKLRGINITQVEGKIMQYILMKNKTLSTFDISHCRADDPANFEVFLRKLD